MNRFISWLDVDLSEAQCFGMAIKTVLALVVFALIAAFSMALFSFHTRDAGISEFMTKEDVFVVVGSLVLAAPIEELGFRLLPALVYWLCTGRLQARNRIIGLVVLMFASSLIFGWMHGGIPTIFTLGPIGFLFAVIFMRCGACRGRLFRGFVFSSMVHLTYNLFLLVIVRTLAE